MKNDRNAMKFGVKFKNMFNAYLGNGSVSKSNWIRLLFWECCKMHEYKEDPKIGNNKILIGI